MKKSIFYLTLLSICFFSCKKDHSTKGNPVPTTKMYKVNLSATGFTQVITNATGNGLTTNGLATNSTADIAGYLTKLYYSVFDSNGKQIHFIQQDSTAANFGNINDSLAAGTYTIQIAAGKKDLKYTVKELGVDGTETLTNAQLTYVSPFTVTSTTPVWKDTYVGRLQLTVNGDINQDVTLNRIVGQLEVVVLDTIPGNANKIVVKVTGEDMGYFIPTATPVLPGSFTSTIVIPSGAKNKPNFTTDCLIGNTATPMVVTISCYDAAGALLTSVAVNDVSCQKNKKTILSGKLFGADNGFNIKLSPWDPSINIPF